MSLHTTPRLVTTVAGLREALAPHRAAAARIGLVPTMGALHEGHLSLVRAARAACGVVVVSVYVNPSQFGPREDFAHYPRSLETDVAAVAACSADFVFAPDDAEVYPPGFDTWVEVGGVSEPLEGRHRPGHFRGVATVVLKLLNMVGPQAAYFGLKDIQQFRVLEQMVRDLNVPVDLVPCATVREADGLAMSSRNAYLSPAARGEAGVVFESLRTAQRLVDEGRRCAATVAAAMRQVILSAKGASIDYAEIVDPRTLRPVERVDGVALAVLAVRLEETRLIDNALIVPPGTCRERAIGDGR